MCRYCNTPVICNHCTPPTGRVGIARLKSRAITFRVSSQCRGNDGGFDIGILTPVRFSIAKGGAKSKVLTSSLPPGGGAHSRALKAEKHNLRSSLYVEEHSSGYK